MTACINICQGYLCRQVRRTSAFLLVKSAIACALPDDHRTIIAFAELLKAMRADERAMP